MLGQAFQQKQNMPLSQNKQWPHFVETFEVTLQKLLTMKQPQLHLLKFESDMTESERKIRFLKYEIL